MRRAMVFAALFGLPALILTPAQAASSPLALIRPTPTATAAPTQTVAPQQNQQQNQNQNGQVTATATATPTQQAQQAQQATVSGIPASSFIDIQKVQPNRRTPRVQRTGSAGTFVSRCGTNANAHQNPDNFIVAPGVSNGAHHTHDYVGNLSTTGFSNDQSLQAAGTTCQQGDKSTYFWPVLRLRKGAGDVGQDGNLGTILRPVTAQMQFRGNATAKVTAMPTFLRVITGNAKAVSQAGANANAQWTCTGFQNRITQKYPLCPAGSKVTRILEFPSCWDGKNVDSANHRTHIVFPDKNSGACPAGTKAVPALRMTLTYNVPQGKGTAIALDTFPEELHDPSTDHADFEQVMPARLAAQVVNCVNSGRTC